MSPPCVVVSRSRCCLAFALCPWLCLLVFGFLLRFSAPLGSGSGWCRSAATLPGSGLRARCLGLLRRLVSQCCDTPVVGSGLAGLVGVRSLALLGSPVLLGFFLAWFLGFAWRCSGPPTLRPLSSLSCVLVQCFRGPGAGDSSPRPVLTPSSPSCLSCCSGSAFVASLPCFACRPRCCFALPSAWLGCVGVPLGAAGWCRSAATLPWLLGLSFWRALLCPLLPLASPLLPSFLAPFARAPFGVAVL